MSTETRKSRGPGIRVMIPSQFSDSHFLGPQTLRRELLARRPRPRGITLSAGLISESVTRNLNLTLHGGGRRDRH